MSCIICDEKVNKTNHAVISCPYCSFESCKTCCQTFLLSQNVPTCMDTKCAKEWTRKFMVDHFPKTFIIGAWKKHKEKILLDKEIALLPATQAVVEAEIQKEKKVEQMAQIKNLINDLQRQYRNLATVNIVPVQPRAFVCPCPANECRGYLSTQWKCGLCDSYTCSDCRVLKGKDAEHVCNPDDLATARLLSKDTKPCPNCSAGIFKIEGCDQMWCTQCHTAFSWKTGHIETRIHNPHFYEWQRRNGNGVAPRVPGDIICGREINHTFSNDIRSIIRGTRLSAADWPSNSVANFNTIDSIVQSISHLRAAQLPHFRTVPIQNNTNLRVKYMRNMITKEDFQTRIHRDNKKNEHKREIHDLLHMFIQNITDILYRARDVYSNNREVFIANPANVEPRKELSVQITNILDEADRLRLYVNECLLDTAKTYITKPKCIIFFTVPGRTLLDVLVCVQPAKHATATAKHDAAIATMAN